MKQREFRKWLESGCPVQGQSQSPIHRQPFSKERIESLENKPRRKMWLDDVAGEFPHRYVPRTISFTAPLGEAPKHGEAINREGVTFIVDGVHAELRPDGASICTVEATEVAHVASEPTSLTKTELVGIPPREESGGYVVGVDPGSGEGDFTCFVKMERSKKDDSFHIRKCITIPGGGHRATHSHEVLGKELREAEESSGWMGVMVDQIALGLDIPRGVAREMLKNPGELMFEVKGGAGTFSF